MKKIKTDGSKTLYSSTSPRKAAAPLRAGVGGIYEGLDKLDPTVDKNSGGAETGTKTYYPAAGAMRVGSTLYYVLKDHLGSASVVTDANAQANVVGEDRFYPFGETRFTTGTMLTDKLFTGQREMAGLGIYHYGARFYSPKLGRFLSADTIVPGYANPQNLNRLSYVTNNPLRYIDPTGHSETDGCQDYGCGSSTPIDYDYDPNPDPEPDPEEEETQHTNPDVLAGVVCGVGDMNDCPPSSLYYYPDYNYFDHRTLTLHPSDFLLGDPMYHVIPLVSADGEIVGYYEVVYHGSSTSTS